MPTLDFLRQNFDNDERYLGDYSTAEITAINTAIATGGFRPRPGTTLVNKDVGQMLTLNGIGAAASFIAVSGGGNSAVVVANFAALPAAAGAVGSDYIVTAPVVPGGTSNTRWRSDGTFFRLVSTQELLVDVTPSVGTATTSEQILKQWLLPRGLLQSLRYMRVYAGWAKSGAVDAATSLRGRLGTAGTVSDTQVFSDTGFVAANRQRGTGTYMYGSSATQVRVIFNGSAGLGEGVSTSVSYPVNTAVTDTDLYLSMSIQMAGSTDVPSIPHTIISAG